MNKIYKVVWNKARNCYVVVSEFAKNHSTSSVSKKSASAVLLAVTVLLSGGVSVYADNLAPDISRIEIGEGATATGQNGVAIGSKTEASGLDSIAIGGNTKATGTDSIAIGDDTTANSYGSVAIGDDIHFTGESATAVGQQAHATSINSTAIGSMTNVDADYNFENKDWRKAGKQSTAIGAYSGSWGDNSTAVGAGAKADGKSSTAVGFFSEITAKNAVALGAYAKAYGEFSTAVGYASEVTAGHAVALGDWSKASREAGWVGYDPITGEKSLDESSTWKATKGAVSIGNGDKNYTRQITDLAAGSEATDAVNVAQLKQVAERANQGWNLSTNGVVTAATNVAPGGNVDFSGDDNVSVSNKETQVTVALNKDVKLNSATFGDTVINANGLTIGSGTSGLEFSKNRVSVGGQQIHDVAAGKDIADAVNMSQLKGVEDIANKGWNLSTNGVATAATNVAPGEYVDFSGDDNVSVSNEETKVKVALNKDVKLNSATFGDTVINANGLTIGSGTSGLEFSKNRVSVGGQQIHDVAAGKDDMDAVNMSQLKGVENIANQGWNLSTNGVATAATNVAPGGYVDFSGDDNITVSNQDTKVKVSLNKDINVNSVQTNALNSKYNLSVGTAAADGKMPFFVNSNGAFYAAGSKFVVDEDGSVKATRGDIGNVKLNDGVFYKHSALRDGELYVGDADGNYSQITSKNAKLGKVTIDDTGRISGVEAGRIAADSTDAVNGSQLHAVQQEAGKHTKVVNGSNITVEETDQDGQKTYKVGLNKDILLGDITGKNVSISGTNGTIETTGYIATKDRVYADKGAKLADVDITGDTISNDKSSVKLDKEGTVTVNNKVTIDGNGKVSGVAAGEISDTSTDAVNGSQLKETNDRVTNVENNVKNIQGDITNIKGDITNIKGDITTIKGDVTILGDRVTKVEQEAGKHTKVVNGSNVTVEETDQDGQKTYKVGLNKDLLLGDITGKNVSISGTNGTIETTGSIATKDKIYADKGAKLADIDITGDTISNGQSSVKLDKEGTVTINGKVSVNQNGKVSGVAAGDISATSTDAVNGGQLYETNQAIANNATNISSLSHSISNLDNRVNKVGAGAAALAALHPLDFDPDAKWDFAAGYGNYRGTNAAAVGAYYRPNEDTMFSVGGTFGNGENMVNAGVSFKLGAGSSHVSTSRVAMAKEIKELRAHMAAQDKLIAQLTGPVNALTGSHIQADLNTLFPDVPKNHWAYDYVTKLAQAGYIEGYPDGNFKGDAMMTRYEFAAVIYRAMMNGAARDAKLGGDENLNKLLKEFEPELEYIRIDTIAKDKAGNPTIQRVRTVKANTNK